MSWRADLDGQAALVLGGTGGIGLACAKAFAGAGGIARHDETGQRRNPDSWPATPARSPRRARFAWRRHGRDHHVLTLARQQIETLRDRHELPGTLHRAGHELYVALMADQFADKLFRKAGALASLGVVEPEDLDAMAVFLASPAAVRSTS